MFMIASDEENISAWQFAQKACAFFRGESILISASHVEEVSHKCENIRMVRLHSSSQAFVLDFDLVQISCGKDFYNGCHA